MDLQTTEATTKCIGNTNWCQCGLCQPLDKNEVPDDYFEGYLSFISFIISFTTEAATRGVL